MIDRRAKTAAVVIGGKDEKRRRIANYVADCAADDPVSATALPQDGGNRRGCRRYAKTANYRQHTAGTRENAADLRTGVLPQ